jgi:hypothetical protein
MQWRMKRSWKPSCLSLQHEKMLVSRLKLQVLNSVNTWKPVRPAKEIQLSKAVQGTTPDSIRQGLKISHKGQNGVQTCA